MNDIEFAHSVSPPLGDLYEQAKKLSATVPGYALTFLRTLAGTFCDTLDPNLEQFTKLERKITSLRNRGLVDPRVLPHLRTLQKHGNIAAHPRAFSFATYIYAEMVDEALAAARQLIEFVYHLRLPQTPLPEYVITPNNIQNLQELSYNALFGECAEARYLVGIHFKEKADALKTTEYMFRVDDGYGFDSRAYIDQANHWFKLAVSDSHLDSLYEYGVYLARLKGDDFVEQRKQGEHYIWQASEKNHADALAFIGDCYFWGSARYDKDLPYARDLYQQAAVQSHPSALAQLGEMYERGLGGPVDMDAAFQCSLQAAEAGFPKAQFHLYILHRQGHALVDEQPAAIAWLEEAAEQKLPEAMLMLAGLIWQKLITGRTDADAQVLYEQCLRAPNTRITAQYELAHLLAEKTADLDTLHSAFNLIENCKEQVLSSPQYQHMLSGCDKLAASLWQQINLAFAKICPHLAIDHRPIAPKRAIIPSTFSRISAHSPVGRNDPCPCGSSKKYKKCCGF